MSDTCPECGSTISTFSHSEKGGPIYYCKPCLEKVSSDKALVWTKDTPTCTGMYLRSNPVIGRATRQDIYEVEGILVTRDKDSLIGRERTIESYSNFMWWYGPIPDAPHIQSTTLRR